MSPPSSRLSPPPGFLDATRKIMETCRAITAGLREMHGVEVLGDPKAMVVAFKCTSATRVPLTRHSG